MSAAKKIWQKMLCDRKQSLSNTGPVKEYLGGLGQAIRLEVRKAGKPHQGPPSSKEATR